MKDVLELVIFQARVILLLEALQDGIDAGDIDEAWNAAQAALPAFQGIQNVPEQWAIASDDEKQAIYQAFKDTLDLQDDAIEDIVEEAVQVEGGIASIILKIKALREAQ